MYHMYSSKLTLVRQRSSCRSSDLSHTCLAGRLTLKICEGATQVPNRLAFPPSSHPEAPPISTAGQQRD